MPEQYSPKRLFLMVPNSLLEEFFRKREQLLDIDWSTIGEKDVDSIFDAWQRCSPEQRSDAERVFRLIWELANPKGLQTLVEEGQFWNVDLRNWSEGLKKPHAKVLWVYLSHERIFQSASRLNRADCLNRRYWCRRADLPVKEPDTSHATRDALANEISAYLWKHQGRGEYCKVHVYLRNDTIHYFFCYPANYVDAPLLYKDGGEIEQPLQKPAFEIIYAYHEDTGELEVFVQGDQNLLHDMEEIFCRLILKEPLPEIGPRQKYNLAPLLNRNFGFPTKPEHQIKQTRVRILRLAVAKPGFGRITLEADERRKRGSVHDLIERFLIPERVAGGNVFVSQVEIEAKFLVEGREKFVRFRITYPDRCTLGDDPEELIVKGYLQSWGLISGG